MTIKFDRFNNTKKRENRSKLKTFTPRINCCA